MLCVFRLYCAFLEMNFYRVKVTGSLRSPSPSLLQLSTKDCQSNLSYHYHYFQRSTASNCLNWSNLSTGVIWTNSSISSPTCSSIYVDHSCVALTNYFVHSVHAHLCSACSAVNIIQRSILHVSCTISKNDTDFRASRSVRHNKEKINILSSLCFSTVGLWHYLLLLQSLYHILWI